MDKDTLFYKKRTIRCNSQILELNSPLVMGILNTTTDSFYDGGKYTTDETIEKQVTAMVNDGADIIDIGAISSRPGAADISENEEMQRLNSALGVIRNKFPELIISIDTYRAKVAAEAINKYNVEIINDISAGHIEPEILDVVAENKTAYIAMHMQGIPATMQKNPTYKHITHDLIEYFANRIELLRQKKIDDIIIDPGFGFGKNLDHNYQLLAGLDCFKIFEHPVLIGLSRKSMIHKLLNTTPNDALSGTIALHMYALQQGAMLLRAHDVKEAKQTIEIFKKIQEESEKSINLLTPQT